MTMEDEAWGTVDMQGLIIEDDKEDWGRKGKRKNIGGDIRQ